MEDLKITGEVEDIIYRNKDNGYTVFSQIGRAHV